MLFIIYRYGVLFMKTTFACLVAFFYLFQVCAWDVEFFQEDAEIQALLSTVANPELFSDELRPQNQLGTYLPIGLIITSHKNSGTQSCTAVLVGRRYALSAKHCFEDKVVESEIFELTSAYFMTDYYYTHGANIYANIVNTYEHCPDTGWCKKDGHPITINQANDDYITSIDLAVDDIILLELDQNLGDGVGSFKIHPAQKSLPEKLQFGGFAGAFANSDYTVPYKYIAPENCSWSIPDTYDHSIYTNCRPSSGISGGPLFYEENGEYFLVGILSAGIPSVGGVTPLRGSRFHLLENSPIIPILDEKLLLE